MLRSEEILNEIEALKEEMKNLKKGNKLDEAHEKISKINDLKKEYEVEKALEDEEEKEIKDALKNQKKKSELTEGETKFLNYIKTGKVNDVITMGDNGALIPEEISTKIIEKVGEMSPLVAKVTTFINGADMKFIKESTAPVFAYVTEGEESAKTDATFVNVTLAAYDVSCECIISKSLLNRTDIDVLNYVINKIASALVKFLEKELILGTSGKMEGLLATTNKVETATVGEISSDELIDVQALIPTSLQSGCLWIINPTDWKNIRKLKDSVGQYLVGNMISGFGFELLGKQVYLSDNMTAGNIFYGDPSGLYLKYTKTVESQVLVEKYAEKNQIAVLDWLQVDSKIVEDQKLAKLVVKIA